MARLLPSATGVLLLSAVLLTACGGGEPQGQMPTPQVQVATPLVERVADWDEFTGRFDAPEHVDVRARVSGYLDAVHFEDGARVEAGQRLFTIDARPFQAELAAAEGRLVQARAELSQARTDLERAERLIASRTISEEAVEQRRTAVSTAQAAVASARAEVETQQLNLEFTEVTAPISGHASARQVDPGNLVSGGNSAGDVLTTIVSSDPIYFEFDASEAVYLRYRRQDGAGEGAPVEVRLQDETEFDRPGEIVFADNAIDPNTGTIHMRARVANPDGLIRPGMLGTARVRGSAPYEAMLLPQTAILSDGARRIVYVVNDQNIIETRTIQQGPLSGNLRVVRSGVAPGDRVVVNGLLRARPGAEVVPQETEIARASSGDQTADLIESQPATSAQPVD
jgi:RND family efflux transporter MFP subunit